jgi:hypothetical protein
MTHFNPTLNQDHYRWGSDGTETGHGWEEAEDTAFSSTNLELDTTYFLRILLQENGGGSTGANTYQLQYNVDGAGWNDVTGASSNVRAVATSNIADDAVTTNRLAGGSGTFISGRFDEADGDTTTSITITTNNFTEVMYSIQFRSADLPTTGATVTFQLVASGDSSIDNYNVTPTANIPASLIEGDGASSGSATVSGIATGIIGEASGSATVAGVAVETYSTFQIRVARALITTSGTTQDITVSGWSVTPDAAIIISNIADTDEFTSLSTNDYNCIGIGWTTGSTSEVGRAAEGRDGVTTTNETHGSGNTYVVRTKNASGTLQYLDTNSLISGGIRLNKGPPSRAFFVHCIFIYAGGDLEVAVGNADVNTTVSGLSFQPDLILASTAGDEGFGSTSIGRLSVGWAFRNGGSGTQYASMVNYAQNGATTTNLSGEHSDDKWFGQETAWAATISSWNSDGWATTTGGAETDQYEYLAIGLRTQNAKIDNATMPTSNGTQSVTGLGWDPGFLFTMTSDGPSINTRYLSGQSYGICWGMTDGIDQYCAIFGQEDNTGTTNHWMGSQQALVYQYEHTATTKLNEATWDQWTSGGYDLDYTTTDSGATQHILRVAIECERVAAGVTEGDGASSGSATVSGVPVVIGEASGSATVSGQPIIRADGASSGSATVSGVGKSTYEGDGASSGAATVSGQPIIRADGASSGAATVSGVGEATFEGDFASSGVATVTGLPILSGDGAASGAATVSGVGQSVIESVGASSGAATVAGVGQAVTESDFASSGAATVAGIGEATFEGDFTASGAATVSGVGKATFEGDFTSSGTATVTGLPILHGDAAASGVATVSGVGQAVTESDFASSGAATVAGVGELIFEGDFASSGTATVAGVGEATFEGDFASSGAATVSGVGKSTHEGDFSSSGVATVSGVGETGASIFAASGVATVTGVGKAIFEGDFASSGAATVTGVGEPIFEGIFASSGAATVAGVGVGVQVITATVSAKAWVSHACAIRVVPDIKATQDTLGEWGTFETITLPLDDPIWDNSYVHYFGACVRGSAVVDGDVVTKTGRASIVATATATGTPTEELADSGEVYVVRWGTY